MSAIPRKFFAPGPSDRSLAAYRSWILSVAEAVGVAEKPNDSEEQWARAHAEFWKTVDASAAAQRIAERLQNELNITAFERVKEIVREEILRNVESKGSRCTADGT